MPLNYVLETINAPALAEKRIAAAGKAWGDWAAWGGVVQGNAESIPALRAERVSGFRCFLIYSGIEGFAWVGEAEFRRAFEKLRGTGLPLLGRVNTI